MERLEYMLLTTKDAALHSYAHTHIRICGYATCDMWTSTVVLHIHIGFFSTH